MYISIFIILWIIYRSINRSPKPSTKRFLTYRKVRHRLDLDVRLRVSIDEPLFCRMKAAVALHPAEPIDHTDLPSLPAGDGLFYYPGARDIERPEMQRGDDRWQTVIAAILAAHRNKLTDWKVLEHNIGAIPFMGHVDAVLTNLEYARVTFNVRRVFLDLARHSADYNAVKWGILVAAMREVSDEELEDLLLLARHSEFTLPLCHAISSTTGWYRHLYPHLTDLLPVTEGWGLYQVIRHVLLHSALWSDPAIRREVIACCVRHGGVAGSPIAFEILARTEFSELLALGTEDTSVGIMLLEVLALLISSEQSTAAFVELSEGEETIKGYLELIAHLAHGIETLAALRGIIYAMQNDAVGWESRDHLRDRAGSMLLERLARETLIEAIRSGNHRETALLLVMEGGMTDLAPIVLQEFRREATPLVIDVLGTIGTVEHCDELMKSLPKYCLPTPEDGDDTVTLESYMQSRIHAAIVRHIGKLRTPAAIGHIKEAAVSPFPEIRVAAMIAMQSLLQWTLDVECRELVLKCLNDDIEFVRESAEATAAFHMLHASLNREGRGSLPVGMIEILN